MFSFKRSLIALVGVLVLIGAFAALMPLVSRGQGIGHLVPRRELVLLKFERIGDTNSVEYFIPEGKRLVIEHVFLHADATANADSQPNGWLNVVTVFPNGSGVDRFHLLLTPQGQSTATKRSFDANQPMKLYLDNPANDGQTRRLSFEVDLKVIGDIDFLHAAITGYLEPAT